MWYWLMMPTANVTEQQLVTDHRQTDPKVCLSMVCHKLLFCYIREFLQFLLKHRATSFLLHFGLLLADLFAPIHVSSISCRSSLNVVHQVFVGLPGLRLPLSDCQFMAIYAGLFSGRRKIWPANLSLLCCTISDKLPKSTLRKTSSLVMW